MEIRLKFTLSLFILLNAPLWAEADKLVRHADFDSSRWHVEASVFECRLIQSLPRYGNIEFYHQSGEQVSLRIDTRRHDMQAGNALLTSAPPPWRHDMPERDLGYVEIKSGRDPLSLDSRRSQLLLSELDKGMMPTLVRQAAFSDESAVVVGISPVNFQQAYTEYRNCAAELLPVNFAQIERSTVFWAVNQRELSTESRQMLADMASYIKADPAVFSLEINGFTDSAGSGSDNLELSRTRAFAVHDYLLSQGVDEGMLATRYFGSTPEYRIIRNERTAADRDRNRRVTILIRRR
ncbi:MAG: OmpA family protein [Pseudomonadales bacterium]|nr:OmpA family protein [Pseudomonadales bacterium]